jgi:UDPglucose 6-dehydrogenase
MATITIIGAGYVGLVTGTCFAQKDNLVTIVENNTKKIDALLGGEVPFYEPGLDLLIQKAIQNKKIQFISSIKEAMKTNPEIIFSCVGTPSLSSGAADLSFVFDVAKTIGQHMQNYCLVINKSTVPVGTNKTVQNIIEKELRNRNLSISFDVASNPEFLREGCAINDFMYPDRVVVGTETEKARDLLYNIYKPFLKEDSQFLPMKIESAELTKYAANSMLALRISFMNQLALLADKIGADITDIQKGIAEDHRIGKHFLNAGIGYGGSCFPKDVKALIHTGKEYNQPMTLIQEIDNVNESQKQWFINKITTFYKDTIANKTIGIWGLSFKPETDDIRSAPSIDIVNHLLEKNVSIIAYDPMGKKNFQNLFGNKISFAQNKDEVIQKSDALLLLTEWKEFTSVAPETFLALKDKVVFDGRNCFDNKTLASKGITYFNVGRNVLSGFKQLQPNAMSYSKKVVLKRSS